MMRMLIQYLMPLILPMVVYFTYVAVTRWGEPDWLKGGPWFTLFALGVLCLIASLVGFALLSGDDPRSTYVAPHFEDGRVVPGGFRN